MTALLDVQPEVPTQTSSACRLYPLLSPTVRASGSSSI